MLKCSAEYITQLFEKDSLPTLRYIAKQDLHPSCMIRPMHSHEEVTEILLVYKGTGIYRSGVHTCSVKEGDLIFSFPKIPHELALSQANVVGVYCFGIVNFKRPDLPANYILPESDNFIRPAGIYFNTLVSIADTLFLDLGYKKRTAYPALPMLFSTFLSLALTIPPCTQKYILNPVKHAMAERVQKYIDVHYTEDFTLDDIAAEMGCSTPYISHVFKDVTGYSPMQYKTRCRIGLAQTYLISSDMSSTQVATMVGYDNTNYFNTVFTKMVGIPPINYRKQYMRELHGISKQ